MAKGRIRSRMELREQYEAAEAREREERQRKAGDEAEAEEEEEETDEADLEEGDEAEEEEEAPVKKKKKAPAKEPRPRKKTTKQVRRRVVWVVYDNSNKKVAQYDYTKRQEADDHAARLQAEKKQTYFVQPFKEEITE
jgi:hypothetical protein